jgi:hypothetical protein
MKKIQSYETELVGNWFEDGDEVKGDKTCERIDWLINPVVA